MGGRRKGARTPGATPEGDGRGTTRRRVGTRAREYRGVLLQVAQEVTEVGPQHVSADEIKQREGRFAGSRADGRRGSLRGEGHRTEQ